MKAWAAMLFVCFFCWKQIPAIEPERVLVLVNASDQESVELGYYYARIRKVPSENIMQLPLPAEEKITWDEYLESLYNPLMNKLLEKDWLSGFGSKRLDSLGRMVSLVNSHKIDALVICKGVPLHIENDPLRLPSRELYPQDRLNFYTNRASVDSELALLPFPKANLDAFFPNPLYRRTQLANILDLRPIVVGRLDGPSYELARELVDHAIQAEKEGVAGRAYVDLNGPHQEGDKWLEAAAKTLQEKGFDTALQRGTDRFNLVDRFDEPFFYFGWYSGGIDGPFTHYNFRFPVGAIALHIHSFTAATIRNGHQHWVGPLVARGVTATFGNTSEPYLYLTHQPHYFLEGLFKGMTAGEAAVYSVPSFSWVGLFIGDPLYLPPLGLKLSPKNEYDVLRTANLAKRAGDSSAFKAVLAEHTRNRHFSTGLWLHSYFLERDQPEKALEYLRSIDRPSTEDPKNWGILVGIAESYFEVQFANEAADILDMLLEVTRTKREVQLQLLNRAILLAKKYNLPHSAGKWQLSLNELTAPDDAKKPGQ